MVNATYCEGGESLLAHINCLIFCLIICCGSAYSELCCVLVAKQGVFCLFCSRFLTRAHPEDLFLDPPENHNVCVQVWRPPRSFKARKALCCKVLLLHGGQYLLWEYSGRICFPAAEDLCDVLFLPWVGVSGVKCKFCSYYWTEIGYSSSKFKHCLQDAPQVERIYRYCIKTNQWKVIGDQLPMESPIYSKETLLSSPYCIVMMTQWFLAVGTLNRFLDTLADSIPQKGTFFITYIMVDGWSGPAGEILRLWPLVMYHIRNSLFCKTERDRLRATSPGTMSLDQTLPQLQLYFLMGLVYSVITPVILPFIVIFMGFAFVVYRYQVRTGRSTLPSMPIELIELLG